MTDDAQSDKKAEHSASAGGVEPELKEASEGTPELFLRGEKGEEGDEEPVAHRPIPPLPPKVIAEPPAKTGIALRRSRWESSSAALRYINSLGRDQEVKVRDSDRATTIFLLLATLLTVLSLAIKPFAGMRLQFVLVCDLLVGVMLVFYVANRFGIINTLTPRQALLTWQLIMGAALFGIFMAVNLAVVIALLLANTSIDIR